MSTFDRLQLAYWHDVLAFVGTAFVAGVFLLLADVLAPRRSSGEAATREGADANGDRMPSSPVLSPARASRRIATARRGQDEAAD